MVLTKINHYNIDIENNIIEHKFWIAKIDNHGGTPPP